MSTAELNSQASSATARLPRQIPYIIGNEACERFSFYGMRNILTPFLVDAPAAVRAGSRARRIAKDVFHIFVIGVYFFPLLGGWLSDRFLGKYRTILWLSLVYCAGHACLARSRTTARLLHRPLLIALGSGGIKPCVVVVRRRPVHPDEQAPREERLRRFYWIINFGSFFASLLMPIFLRELRRGGGVRHPRRADVHRDGHLLGGPQEVRARAAHAADPHSFLRVARTALLRPAARDGARPGLVVAGWARAGRSASFAFMGSLGFVAAALPRARVLLAFGGAGRTLQLDRARGIIPDEAVEGVRAVLRILIVFALVTPFWSLFDQKASTWVLQADQMAKPEWFHPRRCRR